MDGRKNTPLLCLTLAMASLGVASGSATRTMGSRPGEHPRPAVVRSLSATYMEIHCTQICAFGAYCSLSVQSQRQRPCLESVSQCCYVSGLSRDAGSIGELRRRTGRSMHALRRAVANAFPSARFIEFARVVKCNRICPSGQVKLCLSKSCPSGRVVK